MNLPRYAFLALVLVSSGAVRAQAPVLPPGEKEPFLRLEPGGPTSAVNSLAFSPNGRRLYAAGGDKVVRVWQLANGEFKLDLNAYRVPIGPGFNGALNAIALSPDGRWLAAGGLGTVRGGSGFRDLGIVLDQEGTLTPEMRQDRGIIYLFDVRTGAVRLLRGHAGEIRAWRLLPLIPINRRCWCRRPASGTAPASSSAWSGSGTRTRAS